MIPLRKCYEVTGYVVSDCIPLCPNCFEEFKEQQQNGIQPHNEQTNPIFLDSEWDYQPCCDWCKEEIDCNVIEG